jgi:hypothetical protein
MTSNHPFDLVIGLDRSDRKADLDHIDTRKGSITPSNVVSYNPRVLLFVPFVCFVVNSLFVNGSRERGRNTFQGWGIFLCLPQGSSRVRNPGLSDEIPSG